MATTTVKLGGSNISPDISGHGRTVGGKEKGSKEGCGGMGAQKLSRSAKVDEETWKLADDILTA